MENTHLISINCRGKVPAENGKRDARSMEILARYGNAAAIFTKFGVARLSAIAGALDRSVEVQVPSVVAMLQAYGVESIANLLSLYVIATMRFFGVDDDRVNRETVDDIARCMLSCERYRTLNFAFALNYFQELKKNKYKLYGVRPIDFMKALNEYVVDAHSAQLRLHQEQEQRERERLNREYRDKAVTFEQYCKMRGLDPKVAINPMAACWDKFHVK